MRCPTCGAPNPERICGYCRTPATTSRASAYADACRAGWMTPNDVRRGEGLPPI